MISQSQSENENIITLNCSPLEDFARAKLDDCRRVDRLLDIVGALYDAPERSFPDAAEGNASRLEAFYRFFANDHVDPAAIVEPYFKSTQEKIEGLMCVYAVQDSTDLTFESRDGEHHRKQLDATNKYTQTLHVHPTLAVSTGPDGSLKSILNASKLAAVSKNAS